MPEPLQYNLGVVDLSLGGETPSMKVNYDYNWSIIPTVTGTPSTSKYTLLVSHDNLEFKEYNDAAVNVPIEDGIKDNTMPFLYLKVQVSPGGVSSGNVSFSLMLKVNG